MSDSEIHRANLVVSTNLHLWKLCETLNKLYNTNIPAYHFVKNLMIHYGTKYIIHEKKTLESLITAQFYGEKYFSEWNQDKVYPFHSLDLDKLSNEAIKHFDTFVQFFNSEIEILKN